jgi:hypothetical protein
VESRHKPLPLGLSFTHILQTDFVKEPGKTIAIVEIDITSALVIPLSSDFPKMWVKVSLKRTGLPNPFYVNSYNCAEPPNPVELLLVELDCHWLDGTIVLCCVIQVVSALWPPPGPPPPEPLSKK